ncbi:hypothetical protein ACF05T_33705 [Streptomyces lateritius]|uniref:Uncharacterized protein n=1 Tax=Streptomyces lateritius TaxID=67313 RepID=A0ABW6YN92_9ACTN
MDVPLRRDPGRPEHVPAADQARLDGDTDLNGDVRGESRWAGDVRVPDEATVVSPRAGANDDRGGSVEQEIIRAVG